MTLLAEYSLPWERRYNLPSARKKVEQSYLQKGQHATSKKEGEMLLIQVWDEQPPEATEDAIPVPDVAELEARILELEDALASTHVTHASEVNSLLGSHEAKATQWESAKVQLEAEIEAAETRRRVEVDAIRKSHLDRMAEVNASIAVITERQNADREAHIAEIAMIRGVHEREKADMRNAHATEMAGVRDAYAREQAAERSAHSAEMADLRDTHAREMSVMRSVHSGEVAALRTNVANLTDQLTTERTEYAEMLQMAASKAAIENARLQGVIDDLRTQVKSLYAIIQRKPEAEVTEEHVHRFDTQLDDSGWRCGVCGLSKKDYENGG